MHLKRNLQMIAILPFAAIVIFTNGLAFYLIRKDMIASTKGVSELVQLQETEIKRLEDTMADRRRIIDEDLNRQIEMIRSIQDNTKKLADNTEALMNKSTSKVVESAKTIDDAAKKVEETPPKVVVSHTTVIISDKELARRRKAHEAWTKYYQDLAEWKAKQRKRK